METYENMPVDGRRYHLRLSEDSRRRREELWRKVGGAPWERKPKFSQGVTAVRRKKLALMARI